MQENIQTRKLLMLGPLFFLTLHIILIAVFNLQFIFFREDAWQNIPKFELGIDSLLKIFLFHSQPPGFNLLLLIIDQFGSYSEIIFHLIYIFGTCLCVWMLADTIDHWTGSRKLAISASIFYAILPGTHLYSMWGFNTQLVAILTMLCVWSFTIGNLKKNTHYFILCGFSILMIFLVRATFIWFIAIFYLIIVLLSIFSVRKKNTIIPIFFNLLFVLLITLLTLKNLLFFSISSQSSWASENFAKMLIYSISQEEIKIMTQKNPCYKELMHIGVFQDVRNYPLCTTGAIQSQFNPPKNMILDNYVFSNGMLNYNHKSRLVLEKQWHHFNFELVALNPKILFRGLFPSFTEERRGSLVQFLWPNTDYKFIEANTEKLGVIGVVWMLLLSPQPFLSVFLVLWFVYMIIQKKIPRKYLPFSFLFALSIILFFSIAYLFLEIGENQRYRTEIDPILIACSAVAIFRIKEGYNLKKI